MGYDLNNEQAYAQKQQETKPQGDQALSWKDDEGISDILGRSGKTKAIREGTFDEDKFADKLMDKEEASVGKLLQEILRWTNEREKKEKGKAYRRITIADVCRQAYLSEQMWDKLRKEKSGVEQDTILRIAIVLNLGVELTNELIKIARVPQLTGHFNRDKYIIDGLNNGASLNEINLTLIENGVTPLIPSPKPTSFHLPDLINFYIRDRFCDSERNDGEWSLDEQEIREAREAARLAAWEEAQKSRTAIEQKVKDDVDREYSPLIQKAVKPETENKLREEREEKKALRIEAELENKAEDLLWDKEIEETKKRGIAKVEHQICVKAGLESRPEVWENVRKKDKHVDLSRDDMLRIALALGMSIRHTNAALKDTGWAVLSPKDPRDKLLMDSIENLKIDIAIAACDAYSMKRKNDFEKKEESYWKADKKQEARDVAQIYERLWPQGTNIKMEYVFQCLREALGDAGFGLPLDEERLENAVARGMAKAGVGRFLKTNEVTEGIEDALWKETLEEKPLAELGAYEIAEILLKKNQMKPLI